MLVRFSPRYEPDRGGPSGGGTGAGAPAPEGQGPNQGSGNGTGGQDPQTGGTAQTFTQADIDRIVRQRLAEERARLSARFEAEREQAIQEALAAHGQTLEQQVNERVQAELAKRALDAEREKVKAEYGLTDAQAARLVGETPEAIRADADALFGALKRKPAPNLPTGSGAPNGGQQGDALDLSAMTPEQIRKHRAELWKQALG